MKTIYIHDGLLPCVGDILAIVLIQFIYDVRVLRINQEQAEKMKLSSDDFMLGIGHKYDRTHHFDYHQRNPPLRPSGKKYATAGQVWKSFGITIIKKLLETTISDRLILDAGETIHSGVWQHVDRFVEEIDNIDNGQFGHVHDGHVYRIISAMAKCPEEERKNDVALILLNAIDFTKVIFTEIVRSAALRQVSIEKLKSTLHEHTKARIDYLVELERYKIDSILQNEIGRIWVLPNSGPCPWADIIYDLNLPTEFVVYKDYLLDGWVVNCCPIEPDDITHPRKPLPMEWLSNPPYGCTYVHPDLYMAVFKGRDVAVSAAYNI